MNLVIAEQRDGTLNRASWEAVAAAQRLAKLACGAIGVLREEHDPAEVDVGLIDAGVRADPSLVRLGHEHATVHPDHTTGLAQDDLDELRILGQPAAMAVLTGDGTTELRSRMRPSAFDTTFWATISTSPAASGVPCRVAAATGFMASSNWPAA